jgi:hypothetical protein
MDLEEIVDIQNWMMVSADMVDEYGGFPPSNIKTHEHT